MKERLIVVGLGYGDEGKGSIVDFLVRDRGASLVVRYSGGSQCGHRVVLDDGRSHVFSQFGAGTFVPGVHTFLSRFVVVNPLNIMEEDAGLSQVGVHDALDRLRIDQNALIVTPFHQAVNRIRESLRGNARHGSCGEGIGEARKDEILGWPIVIRAHDLWNEKDLVRKLEAVQRQCLRVASGLLADGHSAEWKILLNRDLPKILAADYREIRSNVVQGYQRFLRDEDCVVFEGAQGILLDETHGVQPHTTWTDTTSAKAHLLLDEAEYDGPRETIGVTRTYLTRHGAGPLATESEWMTKDLPDPENTTGEWQGNFRVGTIDFALLRHAIEVDGRIDSIALTCLDRFPYKALWRNRGVADRRHTWFEDQTGVPVSIASYGPTAADKAYPARTVGGPAWVPVASYAT